MAAHLARTRGGICRGSRGRHPEASARRPLSTTDLNGGANVDLKLATNGLTISQPPNLASLPANLVGPITAAWNAASARLVQVLAPYFAFPLPLRFPTGLWGIAPRRVLAELLPKGEGTQDSLALAIARLDSTDVSALDAGSTSRVKDGQDGAIFLSNLLMVELACCLLSHSAELGGLPLGECAGFQARRRGVRQAFSF
jgi:hypothetical protein